MKITVYALLPILLCSLCTSNLATQTPFTCPSNTPVSCTAFDPTLSEYGLPTSQDSCLILSVEEMVDWTQFDTLCHRGTITRNFTAQDCNGNSSTCSQQIVVANVQNYYIRFPDDVYQNSCHSLAFGVPEIFGEDCALLTVTFQNQTIDVVPDACIIIERDWTIINWCQYDPNLDLIHVPNPRPNPNASNPSNWPGPIVSSCDALAPWNPTLAKINPTDPVATNFCTFWSAAANGYRYTQHIRVIDDTAPLIINCSADTTLVADTTKNDVALWNNVFNPNQPAQDLSEVETDLSITGADDCAGANVDISYQLFLDLDGDGTQETVVSSALLGNQPNGLGWNNILYGNVIGPPVATQFDNRTVPVNEKWGFAIQYSVVGDHKTASVKFNTTLAPDTYVPVQLPSGNHQIKWYLTDGCGNKSTCTHHFTVQEGITPSVEPFGSEGFALYQNTPNPFRNSTTIRFSLPDFALAVLTVYEAQGRLLFCKTGDFEPGLQAVELEGDWLKTQGVLFYKLESGAKVAWRKMVLTR